MIPAPAVFNFDFADLRPKPTPLRVMSGPEVPAAAEAVPAAPRRPRWLPRLLAVFPAALPLHLQVAGEGAFSGLVMESLAALVATAGAEAGVRVLRMPGGLVIGSPALQALPPRPQVTLIPCELTPAAVHLAQAMASRLAEPLLVLNGRLPDLDRHLGLDRELPVVRLPLVGRRELEASCRGVPAGLVSRRYGLGILELARRIVAIHTLAQP